MHISLDSALGRQRRLNSVGESVFQIAPNAAAGYSLRSLTGGDPAVVRVRRESDNAERDFNASGVSSGELVNWVNEQITPPLDLRELTATGRDGPIIDAAAAYSLRNLSDSYTGNVVEVRRSSDDATRSFTAAEVADGTLVAWVNASIDKLDLQAGSLDAFITNETATGFDFSVNNVGSNKFKNLLSAADTTAGTYTATLDVVLNSGSLTGCNLFHISSGSAVVTPLTAGANSISLTSDAGADIFFYILGTAVADVSITNITLTQTTADGTVSKWYDQSTTSGTPNANHAVQTDAASQPKIVDAGTLVSGGILSDGAGTFLELDSTLSISDEFDIFFTGTATASDWTGLQRSPYGFSTNSDYPRFNDDSFRYTISSSDSGTIDYNSGFTIGAGTPFLYNFNRDVSDSVGAQINGTAQTNRVTLTGTHQISQLFRRGANTSQVWDGTMSEMIFYPSDQSANRPAIEANINNQYDIY